MTINDAVNIWMPVVAMGVEDMPEIKEAVNMAIASLEAWEKVRQVIDEQYDRIKPYNISCAEGLEMALEIIDKYIKEVGDSQ